VIIDGMTVLGNAEARLLGLGHYAAGLSLGCGRIYKKE
jgi:hypothetical protein